MVIHIIYGLNFCDSISVPVWIVTFVCLGVVLSCYGKDVTIFFREKKYLRLILLLIFLIALCVLFLVTCCGYYKTD